MWRQTYDLYFIEWERTNISGVILRLLEMYSVKQETSNIKSYLLRIPSVRYHIPGKEIETIS